MTSEFRMQINADLLEHVGIKLYSSFPSVIAEYVSNSWDAGAETVEITVPQEPLNPSYSVEIQDDGIGMTSQEIQSNFLRIGRRRRQEESSEVEVKGEKRHVMGRKGIGILSGFSVARVLEVETQKDGEYTALRFDFNEMAKSTDDESAGTGFQPEIIESRETSKTKSGTSIRLSHLEREQRPRLDYLRQKLARQFSIVTQNFVVLVNGKEIDISDRNLKSRCEHTWPIHESNIGPENHDIMGWIGTMKHPVPNQLQQGIAIVANGRVVQEPRHFRPEISDAVLPLPYMVGTIHANFLDEDVDLIRTDRSSVIWGGEPAKSLESKIQEKVAEIGDEWKELRTDTYLYSKGILKPRYLDGYTIDELISEYEGNRVEYKEELSSGKKLAKEVVAFANSDGGVIIVGIEDGKGDVIGINDPDLIEGQIVGWVRNLIDPPISPSIDIGEYEGKYVLIIEVFPNIEKACSVDGRFVQRVGSRIKPLTFDELMRNWPRNSD